MSDPNPAASQKKIYTAPNKEIYSWAIGGIALNALICMFGQAMNFFTVGYGLSAAVVGTAMMLPRVVDAIVDPFMGQLSDNTDTRWGRRKPFLVIGASLASIFIFILWWGDKSWDTKWQLVFLTVMGTAFYVSWGLYSMAWTALGYELTDDYNERSRIASISGYFTMFVLLLNGWTYWFALRPLFHHGVLATVGDLFAHGFDFSHMGQVLSRSFKTVTGGPTDEINGIRWISSFVVIVSLITASIAARNCRERFTKVSKNHTPIGQALKETFKNRPFIILMLFKLFQVFGERVFQGLLFYIGIYYVCKGDKTMATAITGNAGVYATLVCFTILPFVKPISMKLGKKAGLIIPAFVALVLLLAQPYLLTPEHPYLLLVPLILLNPLSVLSNSMISAIVPDICDLDELEHGERREGLFTSVVAFMGKLEISLSVLIVGWLVGFSGVDQSTTFQAEAVLQKLLWFAIAPGMFFTFCALISSFFFNMTEETMTDVRKQLEVRRTKLADGTVIPG